MQLFMQFPRDLDSFVLVLDHLVHVEVRLVLSTRARILKGESESKLADIQSEIVRLDCVGWSCQMPVGLSIAVIIAWTSESNACLK